ncbi:MAG TPA: ATP-dependent DNA helicase [Nocardioidaceae bacterium]|nr:ATP-dependent DNA helicase [Nocardioidaceae bacterium]
MSRSTRRAASPVTYRLVLSRRQPVEAPALDASQRQVVDHAGGPLLVLAGPGTGKTTTLVEAVVDRIVRRGVEPHQVLALTFSRKAAEELRDRITGRLHRTVTTPLSSTFHSFCYALVRRFQPAEAFLHPLQLLSAPEQDVRVRELLAGSRESGKVSWPPNLDAALRTRGFAQEVGGVLARARELSLDPDDLRHVSAMAGRPEWAAVGEFFEEYLDVLDAQNLIDYSELVHRAMLLAETPEVQRVLREELRVVFVDEYQDTDPAQVRLLRALAGDGRDLVVVGDPDQSVYGFRGADVRGILRFPHEFRSSDGAPAPVVALGTTRRFGSRLLLASRRVAAGLGIPGSLEQEVFERFRNPHAADNPYGDGRAEVCTYSSSAAELEHIAERLRRAHLEDGVPWEAMAVLVRSGRRSIAPLRRALVAAGVPVEVSSDEVPLRHEPAVQPLLLALRVAAAQPPTPAEVLTPDCARVLLMSPLGDMDATRVRRLARLLRDEDRLESGPDRSPRPSGELLAEALADPRVLAAFGEHPDPAVRQAHRLSTLLERARALIADGEPPEQALWALWSGTTWPRRLRAAVDRGGAAARAAHRDLDAVCALFETAGRAEDRSRHRGVQVFLDEIDSQRIPGDTLAERGSRGGAVRLLTAHRSKGLEWRMVVVAGVQEGAWPDLRRRGSLLQADRMAADGLQPPVATGTLLAEERRLFYVAVTRARQRLLVTAVQSPDADGEQPSRLVDELGVTVEHVPGRPRRPMSLSGLVGELRRVAADPDESETLRAAAAARLARLADATDGHEALAPHADPDAWWGLRPLTHADIGLRPDSDPVALSGSAVSALQDCPLRWFLSREAGGESAGSTSQGFGRLVHVLAEGVAAGQVPAEAGALRDCLDQVWHQLQFAAPWIARRERTEAELALERFVVWHHGRSGRELLAAEHGFEVTVPVTLPDGRVDQAVVRGSMDRVEVDEQGRVVVVDLKTGKTPVTGPQVREHPQLGIYQLVVEHGAVADLLGGEDVPATGAVAGGAELVQLRQDDNGMPKVQHQHAPEADESGATTASRHLSAAVQAVRGERFAAQKNTYCNRCDFRRLCPAQPGGLTVLSPMSPDQDGAAADG